MGHEAAAWPYGPTGEGAEITTSAALLPSSTAERNSDSVIAALGFANYVLFKLYGVRGIELTGFLGGLVDSTVTVTELARRVHETHGRFADAAFRGVILATAAMLVRNGVILLLLAPAAFRHAAIALALMLAGAGPAAVWPRRADAK